MKIEYRFGGILRKLLFLFLVCFILPGLAVAASRTPVGKTDTNQPATKADTVKRTPANPVQGIKKPQIQAAEITRVEIDTYPTGDWFWKATVRNTGTVELDRNLVVQGYKKSVGQNTWEKVSQAVIGNGFMPHQIRDYKRDWVRCCRTGNFKVEIKDNANNAILDSKMYATSLSTTIPQPNGASITQIEWNDATRQWRATLRSVQPWTLKFAVQGYLWHNGLSSPAGGSVVTLTPNGQASTLWLHANGAQNGDMLKVHIKNLMPNCNESNEDCGFEQYKFIIIPTGNTF